MGLCKNPHMEWWDDPSCLDVFIFYQMQKYIFEKKEYGREQGTTASHNSWEWIWLFKPDTCISFDQNWKELKTFKSILFCPQGMTVKINTYSGCVHSWILHILLIGFGFLLTSQKLRWTILLSLFLRHPYLVYWKPVKGDTFLRIWSLIHPTNIYWMCTINQPLF